MNRAKLEIFKTKLNKVLKEQDTSGIPLSTGQAIAPNNPPQSSTKGSSPWHDILFGIAKAGMGVAKYTLGIEDPPKSNYDGRTDSGNRQTTTASGDKQYSAFTGNKETVYNEPSGHQEGIRTDSTFKKALRPSDQAELDALNALREKNKPKPATRPIPVRPTN